MFERLAIATYVFQRASTCVKVAFLHTTRLGMIVALGHTRPLELILPLETLDPRGGGHEAHSATGMPGSSSLPSVLLLIS